MSQQQVNKSYHTREGSLQFTGPFPLVSLTDHSFPLSGENESKEGAADGEEKASEENAQEETRSHTRYSKAQARYRYKKGKS